MSFRFKSQTITLDNYREIFKACTQDILDEIRLAILDDTPIATFIEPCGNDSFKLGQLRKAVREMVHTEYLNPLFSGKVIEKIRIGESKGYDMSALLIYVNKKGLLLSNDVLEILADFILLGVDVSKVDFTKVPSNQVSLICKGLYNKYPMWLLVGNNLTNERIELLQRGMQLGVDIHPFLCDGWSDDVIISLFSYVKKININDVLSYISPRFTRKEVNILLNLRSKGYPIDLLAKRDKDGNPIYNEFQFKVLSEALQHGIDSNSVFNPYLSDEEMQKQLDLELKEKNRILNVSLNKKH